MKDKGVEHPHPHEGHHDDNSVYRGNRPYWQRAHKDPIFWIAFVLMVAAITMFVLSDNLSIWPRHRAQQSPSGAVTK
jgi:hypothetical protein